MIRFGNVASLSMFKYEGGTFEKRDFQSARCLHCLANSGWRCGDTYKFQADIQVEVVIEGDVHMVMEKISDGQIDATVGIPEVLLQVGDTKILSDPIPPANPAHELAERWNQAKGAIGVARQKYSESVARSHRTFLKSMNISAYSDELKIAQLEYTKAENDAILRYESHSTRVAGLLRNLFN